MLNKKQFLVTILLSVIIFVQDVQALPRFDHDDGFVNGSSTAEINHSDQVSSESTDTVTESSTTVYPVNSTKAFDQNLMEDTDFTVNSNESSTGLDPLPPAHFIAVIKGNGLKERQRSRTRQIPTKTTTTTATTTTTITSSRRTSNSLPPNTTTATFLNYQNTNIDSNTSTVNSYDTMFTTGVIKTVNETSAEVTHSSPIPKTPPTLETVIENQSNKTFNSVNSTQVPVVVKVNKRSKDQDSAKDEATDLHQTDYPTTERKVEEIATSPLFTTEPESTITSSQQKWDAGLEVTQRVQPDTKPDDYESGEHYPGDLLEGTTTEIFLPWSPELNEVTPAPNVTTSSMWQNNATEVTEARQTQRICGKTSTTQKPPTTVKPRKCGCAVNTNCANRCPSVEEIETKEVEETSKKEKYQKILRKFAD